MNLNELDYNRWHAVVTYNSEAGPIEVEHDFPELADLHDLIEQGPNFGAIESIVITYTGVAPKMTLEEAKKL